MSRWVAFEQSDGMPILIDMEQVDAVTPQEPSKPGEPAMMRLWFGCPKDEPTPEQDIYGSILVRGSLDRLVLLLGAETFSG
jgi:hypothetical protein